MNIDGHEVERRQDSSGEHRVFIDGQMSDFAGSSESDWYESEARRRRERIKTLTVQVEHADLVAEFVRREAGEKAAADAARELDRRALLACNAWHGCEDITASGKAFTDYLPNWHNVVRALDADAAEQAT